MPSSSAFSALTAYYRYQDCMSFIWELNDQTQDRNCHLRLNSYNTQLVKYVPKGVTH